ncbi:hypothetical protein NHX12_030851 [Muraenolepis orangiensis]|uniref:FAM83 N-terminal domain-containing protein n=1 Tax=Muraenolepis orangiensis TaxID=630683 RepID=A0A9Q0EET4_9TELE|nr:hypothetical protein NHX12_030851 [Muraenolepis orangiensis]
MSNSHQQSLDEEAVFLPVTEACPDFLHCEGERLAVEELMSVGPGAFYSRLGMEKLGSFLSQEEVNQISGWVQDYAISPTQAVPGAEEEEEGDEGDEGNGEEGGGSAARCLTSCYFPTFSDAPAPCLDLGWPERSAWPDQDSVKVCTSPPEEGQPPIREIVRRHLQNARQVIAIVTDKLTDNAVIGDLHSAASRGVPVYIILNQRSTQEDYTPSKLRHPHMQLRLLGGKTFCSREGRMVVGQMKDNYILVDLETVIHGSYSLTWTDAHLHRQLVTVLSGPVVESFDREFRILFAASLPVPEVRAAPRTVGDSTHYRLSESSDLWYPNRPMLEPVLSPPPPPPVDSPLDWEALGVFSQKNYLPDPSPTSPPQEAIAPERPTQNAVPFEKLPLFADEFSNNYTKHLDKRIEPKIERKPFLFKDGIKDVDDRTMFTHVQRRKETTLQHDVTLFPTNQRQRTQESFYKDEHVDPDELSLRAEKQPSSRKPLILRVPQNDHFSSLSDIMRRLQPRESTSTEQRRAQTALSEMSRSMMDLSTFNTDSAQERGTAVPRLHANFFDPGRMTPAVALMRKRNDEIKKLLASGVELDSDNEDGDDEEEVMALDDSESEEDEEFGDKPQDEEGSEMESDLEGRKDEGKVIVSEFVVEKDNKSEDNKIVKDLDQMSQKEKLKLLKKESPEMLELIQDFKTKLAELKDELQPLVEMVKDGRIPPGKLINDLGAVDARLGPQIRRLLAGDLREEATRRPSSRKGAAPVEAGGEASEEDSDDGDEAALCFYREVEERLRLKKKSKNKDPNAEKIEENEDDGGVTTDLKRGITYEMSKNKGLTPKRKKINRNPRVKHREKFRRAKIKRKGQVREVRREETRYSGEHSGIRSGLKKSVKLA